MWCNILFHYLFQLLLCVLILIAIAIDQLVDMSDTTQQGPETNEAGGVSNNANEEVVETTRLPINHAPIQMQIILLLLKRNSSR